LKEITLELRPGPVKSTGVNTIFVTRNEGGEIIKKQRSNFESTTPILFPQNDINNQQETSLDQLQGGGYLHAIPNRARNRTIFCMEFVSPLDLFHLFGVGFEKVCDMNPFYD
jgi:hypothetical protein